MDNNISKAEQELFMKIFGSFMLYNINKIEEKEGIKTDISPGIKEYLNMMDEKYKFTDGQKDIAIGGIKTLLTLGQILKNVK
jgi:hypothetical protein